MKKVNMTLLKKIALIVCLSWAGMAAAVGFGGINVISALDQPLLAEIDLTDVTPAENSRLQVKLASPEQYQAATLDYPSTLPKLNFVFATRANGSLIIKVSTDESVKESLVHLLLELTWPSGQLVHEYSFMLDVAKEAVAPAPNLIESATLPAQESAETGMAAPSAIAKNPASHDNNAAPITNTVTVKRGDTLHKIALQNKATDVSLERMLVALYRANTDAFVAKNMNRLQAGKILHLPDNDQLAATNQREAEREIHAQVSDWNAYRQKLSRLTTNTPDSSPSQEASGKIAPAVAEKSPVEKSAPKEVLKLSKGAQSADATQAPASEKSNEDVVAQTSALKEAETRTALLEKNIKNMQRLIELREQIAAEKAAKTEPAVSAVPATPTVAVGVNQAPAASKTLADWMKVVGVLGGLCVLALIYFVLRSSKKPEPIAGDTLPSERHQPVAVDKINKPDPIVAANFLLNFGSEAQAEKVLSEAILEEPANNRLKLKLLKIYAERKDRQAAETVLQQIEKSADTEAIKTAQEMIDKLETKPPVTEISAGDHKEKILAATEIVTTDVVVEQPEKCAVVEIQPIAEAPSAAKEIGLKEISLMLDDSLPAAVTTNPSQGHSASWHEVATKIDLAKAYQAMGDEADLREILAEVMQEGDDEQRRIAEKMLKQLG